MQEQAGVLSFSYRFENLSPAKVIVLDIVERTIFLITFGFFFVRMLPMVKTTPNIATVMVLVSELLPVILIVSRKVSHTISDKPLDWALAITAAAAPLLAVPALMGTTVPQALCDVIILTGFLIQISAKVVIWRSFGIVAANRGVKVTGPYRFVRHPMYAGYTIAHMGFLLAFPSLFNAALYSATLAIQIARLLREEKLLNQDPKYRTFSSQTRFRLLPGLF